MIRFLANIFDSISSFLTQVYIKKFSTIEDYDKPLRSGSVSNQPETTIEAKDKMLTASTESDYGTDLFPSENSRYASYYKPKTPSPVVITDDGDDPDISFDLTFLNQPDSPPPKPTSDYDRVVSNFYFPASPISKYNYSFIDTIVDVTSTLTANDFFKIDKKNFLNKITKERLLKTSKLKKLSHDQYNQVLKLWNSNDINKKVKSRFAIDITIKDLKTLKGTNWLNDNIIDFYLNLISLQNSNIFCWTTHFYTTLLKRGYSGVARWSKRKKINVNSKNLIIIPINILSTHWSLAIVDNINLTITYYDSLNSSGNLNALLLIKDYMIQEAVKNNSPLNYHDFKLIPNFKTPQQENGSDCGVFTCTCANFIANNKPLNYSQNDMSTIRSRMCFEILNEKLID